MKKIYKHNSRNKLEAQVLSKLCKSRILSFDPELRQDCIRLSTGALQKAQKDLFELLLSLPNHLEELKQRITSSSLFSLRAVLFIHVDQDLMTLEEADQLAPLCRVLGLGQLETCVERWFRHEKKAYDFAKLKSFQPNKRQIMRLERGLSLLFHSPSGQAIFESLNETDRVELSGPWVRPMFRLAEHELFPRYALFALYKSTAENQRLTLLVQFEKCRKRVQVKALPAYEKLLPELQLNELDFILAHLKSLDELNTVVQKLCLLPDYVKVAVERIINHVDEVS